MSKPSASGRHWVQGVVDEALQKDPSFMVLSEEESGVVSEQRITTPISERASTGLALGLALAGRRVLLELPDTGAMARAASLLDPWNGDLPMPMPVCFLVPYGTEASGIDQPVGRMLCSLEGLTVLCGSTPGSMARLMRFALAQSGPTLLLEPRMLSSERGEEEVGDHAGCRVARDGRDLTLVAWGTTVSTCLEAAETLMQEGLDVEVLDLEVLAPLDRNTLAESVRRTGRILIAHNQEQGLADQVRQIGVDEAFLSLEAPPYVVASCSEAIVRAVRDSARY